MAQRVRDVDDIDVFWLERERPYVPARVREDDVPGYHGQMLTCASWRRPSRKIRGAPNLPGW